MEKDTTIEGVIEKFTNESINHEDSDGFISLEFAKLFLHSALSAQKEEIEREKNQIYHERDCLVAALSKVFPSYLAKHDIDDVSWDQDWRNIVYINLPTGQVSWHIHDDELKMFSHLDFKENNWDGHSTKEKYRRLESLPSITSNKEKK